MLTPPGNRRLRTVRPTSLFALEAQKHLAAGRAKQAVEVCKMGLVYYPEHVTGYVVLAKAFLALGKGAQAVNVLRDGYRRTGVEQLESLRAEISGESPTRQPGRSIDRSATHPLRGERQLSPEPASTPTIDLPAAPTPRDLPAESVTPLPPIAFDAVEAEHFVVSPEVATDEPITADLPEEEAELEEFILPAPEPEAADMAPTESAIVEPAPVVEADAIEPEPEAESVADADTVTEARVVDPTPELEHALDVPTPIEPEAAVEPEADPEPADERNDQVDAEAEIDVDSIAEVTHDAVTDIDPATDEESVSLEEPVADEEAEIVEEIGVDESVTDEETIDEAATTDEEPAIEQLSEEEAGVAEHQLDELLALLDMSTEDDRSEESAVAGEEPVAREIGGEQAPAREPVREQTPDPSQEFREALDETLPSFASTDTIPELRAPAQRPMEPAPAEREMSPERGRSLSLAIHSRMNVTRLRSSNLRLIPGLEFAPLRHEDQQQRRQSIAPLIDETVPEIDLPDRLSRTGDAPPLPSFGPYLASPDFEEEEGIDLLGSDLPPISGTFSIEAIPATPLPRSFHNRPEPREGETLTPLEELARRLEKARIPVIEEAEPRHAFEPSIVSDTFASILVAQGAYAEALKAYQTLARTKPERYDHYQQLIHDMQERILNEEDRDELEDSYEPE